MSALTWTPELHIVGPASARVELVPSEGRLQSFRVISFGTTTRDHATAEALSACFREVRVDPGRDCLEMARDLWSRVDTRERPKPG